MHLTFGIDSSSPAAAPGCTRHRTGRPSTASSVTNREPIHPGAPVTRTSGGPPSLRSGTVLIAETQDVAPGERHDRALRIYARAVGNHARIVDVQVVEAVHLSI